MKNICNKPKVMLLCGMTGSGKTTLAANLERDYAAVRFSIDEWMIKLYGHQPIQADFDRLMNDIKELISLVVERLMAIGINVILDYGFWQASERDRVARLTGRQVA
jgi:predicted kinase